MLSFKACVTAFVIRYEEIFSETAIGSNIQFL